MADKDTVRALVAGLLGRDFDDESDEWADWWESAETLRPDLESLSDDEAAWCVSSFDEMARLRYGPASRRKRGNGVKPPEQSPDWWRFY